MAVASSALSLPLPPSSTTNPSHRHDHHHSRSSSTISNPSPKLKTPTIRSRLSRICQEGQPHLARQLFDTIPRPTTVLWNAIIIGFICNNMPQEALLFYAQMKRSSPHTKCDAYTYSSTLKACAEARDLRLGKAVHCHFLRCLSNPSRILYNSLLNMYATCLNCQDVEMGYSMGSEYSKNDLVCKVFDSMRRRNVIAWNTMISWYVKTERYLEAMHQFRMMMKMGIRPSPVSFVHVFPALSSLRDHKNANALYGLLLKSGEEYANNLFVVSSAIFMYSELGCLDFARKVFDRCLERNTEVWNTMLSGYVQKNCPVEVIELFLQAMESEQTALDDVTFLSILSAVSQLQQLDLARQFHGYIIKNLAVIPVIIQNAIIVMYSRCSSIQTSFEVFDKVSERDVVSWNTMVSALVQNGLDDEGLLLVYEMQKQGFVIDSVTVIALLSAASNLRNMEIGKQTHAFIIRHFIHFEGMDVYLIDMYAKSGLIRMSRRLFETNCSSNKDQATWNSIIAGFTQNGLIDEAFVIFRQMTEQKVIPNAVTVASLLPACSAIGSIDLGKQLHGFSIRNSLDQNVFVATALVDMYSKSGAIHYSEIVFANAHEKNSVTYTTMVLGYGQHGMGKKALSLFYSTPGSGVKPDSITLVAILSACSYSGLVDEGLRIFNSMESDYEIQPSDEHNCCVADMLGKAGRVAEAYEFVKELGEEGNISEIWGSLLGACRLHGQFELGEIIAKKLIEIDRGNNITGYHVLLSNMYAEKGNWKSVDRLRKDMREKGLRKEVGCSWIEIAGHVNCFVSKNEEHPQFDKINTILEGLATEMKYSYSASCLSSSLDIWIANFDE